MPGRNKPETGRGMAGAKRHGTVLQDPVQGITKVAIRRLARRAGVKRIPGVAYGETDGVVETFIMNVLHSALANAEHANRQTVTATDIVYALKQLGRNL